MIEHVPHPSGDDLAPRKAGRPHGTARTARTAVIPTTRATPEQRAKYDRLGGGAWLLAQIDSAPEPDGR